MIESLCDRWRIYSQKKFQIFANNKPHARNKSEEIGNDVKIVACFEFFFKKFPN